MIKKFILFLLLVSTYGTIWSQTAQYSDRTANFQLVNISMHIIPDWDSKSVSGNVKTTLVPVADGFNSFELDAIAFEIKKIALADNESFNPDQTEKYDRRLMYSYDGKKINIELGQTYNTSDTISVFISYSCRPQRGLYFIYPTTLDPSHPYQIWTQGQAEDNKHWLPIYDYPDNKATTEMYVDLPPGMVSISNGALMSSEKLTDEKVRHHWKLNKPHSTYLIMLAAGEYHIINDTYNNIPIQSFVAKDKINTGEYTFRNTKSMIDLFSDKFGGYPWVNYKQVVVTDFIFGGMENTTATVLNDRVYYTPEIETNYSGDGLIAHELGHMWWGDNTTCRTWPEIWLNESFATYASALWEQKLNGNDAFDYEILNYMDNSIWIDSAFGRLPIRTINGHSGNTYGKGAAILNTMKFIIGEENFYNTLRNFQKKYSGRNVVTGDLIEVMNETVNSGRTGDQPLFDYTWMFDQYIFKAGYPELNVFFDIADSKDMLNMTVKQVQPEDSITPVFRMPVDILIKYKDSEIIQSVILSQRKDEFSFPLKSEPEYIIFDAGNHYIKKLYTNLPVDMLLKQIAYATKAVDKISAIRQLSTYLFNTQLTEEARRKLDARQETLFELYEKILNSEVFYGVKIELIKLIRNYPPEIASNFLKKRYKTETDPRVKGEILKAIGRIKQSVNADYIYSEILNESNPYIVSDGINGIIECADKDKLYDYISPFIGRNSHRNVIANAVINALGKMDTQKAKDNLIGYAFGINVNGRVRTNATNELRKFASDEDVKKLAMENFDWNFRFMKYALIGLLGDSGDSELIPFLEKKRDSITDEPISKAIDRAIEKLKAGE
ncbi:MAG: M1 family metallopeptidase [Ignavibacteriaceae bacterium]|jgi:aminopeptidase N|nr:MAG: M1 family peptidase [Chlorobiota bacterium]KXK06389.1 MAG: Aminopeptidase N [Chlorobi bacterium OLB4]MBV6399099.1 hypothetical protein [Ignavibacteria bacterium]MCC6885317.1 M1 family metallopeptidase [Ignavibacteriales bacterium]MCE7953280.1 M1 family peptidase [Chlorobi bacterium CHB7]MDL1887302.1 M1 family metallopeptidase [Ignavibacteria bacterium CHB1]MEB2330177.1 M1 family metallopeptidase [Ignavibacteriaceae bacterium]OQY78240.1 MAG: hypothetical protein B6D43_03760 [Ignavibac